MFNSNSWKEFVIYRKWNWYFKSFFLFWKEKSYFSPSKAGNNNLAKCLVNWVLFLCDPAKCIKLQDNSKSCSLPGAVENKSLYLH